jgi:two-component system, LytTR family, response regulator
MIRCIAVDDEPLALELLVDNIGKVPFLKLVGTCANPIELMDLLQRQEADLLFLDIQMPGMTGMQFLQGVSQRPMVVLVTAYEKHALEAFGLDVVDYLVKPVPFERFLKACNKARDLHQLKQHKSPPGGPDAPGFFFVPSDYSLLKVETTDIVMVEGLKDYVKIHLKSTNKAIVTRMSMKSIEDLLPPQHFVRVHRSYIVAIAHISSVRKTSVFIGEHEIPIGDSYREVVDAITGKNQ